MKAIILAGGSGTRLSEETIIRPKPMVEIGGKPILWHIMKIYSYYGINDFVICLGYMGYKIKEYFSNYLLHTADVTIDIQKNSFEIHKDKAEPWKVTLVETGEDTMTGGRLLRVLKYMEGEDFCFTYGDGVADIDIGKLVNFHTSHDKLVTITAVHAPGRFGAMMLEGNRVKNFEEKPVGGDGWINGGFFVLNPACEKYLSGDDCVWEQTPLEQLTRDNELVAYSHEGFWQPMDTLRDKKNLESLWKSGHAPWKVWK